MEGGYASSTGPGGHLVEKLVTGHYSLATRHSPLATCHPPPTDPPKLASFACPIPPWFVLSCNLPETNTRAIWLRSDAFLSPTAPSLQIHCSLATGRSPPEPPSAGTSEVRSCADLPRLLSDTVPALPTTERGPITPSKPYLIIHRGGDSDGQITPISRNWFRSPAIIAILALVDSSSVVVGGRHQLRFRESWRPDAPLGRSGPTRMSGNGSTPGQVP
jgi:hypothetical protein